MKRTLLALSLLSCAPLAQAQATDPAVAPAGAGAVAAQRIPRLDGAITIDGKLDEAAWQGALLQELGYELQPGDNIPAPVATQVRIGYSDDALYVAFHAVDPEPQKILAHLRDRDAVFNDDWVGIFMDTFDDQRRAYELMVNPLGVQADVVRDDAAGEEDASWDGMWASAGQLTATGYDVEMRIPFSTLRFADTDGMRRWGILFIRNYPRGKRHQFASHPSPRTSRCFECNWGKYEGMAGVRQGRNLLVAPSLTAGVVEERPRAGTPWGGRMTTLEPGLDVSWAPSPAMTLNATINPDFSQVETDQLQLSFNDSFALFFPEKRPFFMEGADYFNTPFTTLYTRQIADPDFGLRMTGRTAHGAYGGLVARDAVTQLLVPGVLGSGFRTLEQKANVAVGRYRHDFNDHFSVGATGTFRHGDGYGNDLAGIDARWRSGAHGFTGQLLRSQSTYPQRIVNAYRRELGDDATPAGNALLLRYNYGNGAWSFNTQHQRIDPGFRADLGFIGQVGFRKSVIGGGRTWYRDGKAFNRINIYSDWDITHRFDGQLLERELEAQLNINGPMQSYIGVGATTRVRFWNGAMFDEDNLHLEGNFMPWAGTKVGAYFNTGRQLDLTASRGGHRDEVGAWINAPIGRSIDASLDLSRTRLRRDGGVAFDATLAILGASWQLDTRQRLRLSLQGSDVARDPALYAVPLLPATRLVDRRSRDWAGQLVYSYKVNPRTAFYAGASYGAFMDDDHRDLFGNTRSLFLKYSYAWEPQF